MRVSSYIELGAGTHVLGRGTSTGLAVVRTYTQTHRHTPHSLRQTDRQTDTHTHTHARTHPHTPQVRLVRVNNAGSYIELGAGAHMLGRGISTGLADVRLSREAGV